MAKTNLIKLLCDLNSEYLLDYNADYDELFQDKYKKITNLLSLDFETISSKISEFSDLFVCDKITSEWKFISLNFYLLYKIELNTSEYNILSVQEIKNVKKCIKNVVTLGISRNLQEKLPNFLKFEMKKSDLLYNYTILKCTLLGFCYLIKKQNLRLLILSNLQTILTGLYQIVYCPLKKANSGKNDDFLMTQELYNELVKEQQIFREILLDLRQTIHPVIIVREIMILFQSETPMWFKKSISNTLTEVIRSEKGVESITLALLDGVENDRMKTWKSLEILTKLIVSCRKFHNFTNICQQVLDLLKTNTSNLLVFERLVISCARNLEPDNNFLIYILRNFQKFTDTSYKFVNFDLTEEIKQNVRLIYGTFVDDSVNLPCLDILIIKSVIGVVFQLFLLSLNKGNFTTTNRELGEILIKFLDNNNEINEIFDNFLFGFNSQFRNDIIVEINDKIIVANSEITVLHETLNAAENISKLLKTEGKIKLFGYLLTCITNREKYFKSENEILLNLEENSPILNRLLIIHKLLAELADDKIIQKSLRENPETILKYFQNVLKENDVNSESIFITLMILETLITNSLSENLAKFNILKEPIEKIKMSSNETELKEICVKLLKLLEESQVKLSEISENKTDLDLALEDVCDPLLPVRGHGLMSLAKLVKERDKHAMKRKQYILNLFQLHLKNEDSFIYLSAIQGLAIMTDVFPDTVLTVLCDEYVDFNRKGDDGHEVKVKLGEVLVRATKNLGEMAPKYKSLLLNTFLSATKDDDHLQRASSLSNLGEICRVLNYKLGTIVTEILVCVHGTIATDKSIEARRAAVTVIRQLFAGLGSEMLSFLKDDILPIYRTLKDIYYNDNDDVMRLQAQLALEELNENMRIIMQKPQLHIEKKIVMLD